jgi:hypothetical protein
VVVADKEDEGRKKIRLGQKKDSQIGERISVARAVNTTKRFQECPSCSDGAGERELAATTDKSIGHESTTAVEVTLSDRPLIGQHSCPSQSIK